MNASAWTNALFSLFTALLLPWVVSAATPDTDAFRRQVEADWLLQEKYRTQQPATGTNVPAAADAIGGCDGIKSGAFGFHTGRTKDPWWQVDLGEAKPIARVVIWNRGEPEAAALLATNLSVRLSNDAQNWTTAYTHDGTKFYGHRDRKPLEVTLAHPTARFVRIQLAGARHLHLDEVEVFGPEDPRLNTALGHPADQSGASEWSLDHRPPPEPDWSVRTREVLAHCEQLMRELKETGTGRKHDALRNSETPIRLSMNRPIGARAARPRDLPPLPKVRASRPRSGRTGSWSQYMRRSETGLSRNRPLVGQTFFSAGSGGFPVAHRTTGLESPVNRQAGKPALHPGSWAQGRLKNRREGERNTPAGNLDPLAQELDRLQSQFISLPSGTSAKSLYLEVRWLQRRLALANPLLDFDAILVTKRMPGSYSHMSDQFYGWWSRPGGGIYLLSNFRDGAPQLLSLTDAFLEPGSFLRPSLSYDGRKILFAWCRHYPHLAAEKDKINKDNLPEDAFYHVFEMNLDGTGLRQLTHGKYDDFDGRYLPDGRIVFLSTRRGQALQVGRASAQQTLAALDLPNCYVRCGGGEWRPVAVYTLHTMNADGSGLLAISPFEMFEWDPAVGHDGAILHARWDYIDRDNMPFMSLWAINPDGTHPRLVYKNYTRSPHCVFEPQPVPGSQKILFTASGHHSHTMGSLVLLDPAAGTEGTAPITRLTPEVPFPEIEGWPVTYYTSPWPLSERFHLVAWGDEGAASHAARWHRAGGRWEGSSRPPNGMGIYFFDAAGHMELLYRDPDITTMYPIPIQPRLAPPALPDTVNWDGPEEGRFLVQDVYHGATPSARDSIKSIRVIAVPAKTQPWMNRPEIGVTRDDPGKCVLGTVPVEEDGSAYFRVPAGVIVFFQTLDERGRAVRTMRSATHAQPGQTVSCIGCHADRTAAPPTRVALASLREPSRIRVGPEGSWPLRFDRLIQPVLDRECVNCHKAGSDDAKAAKFDLTSAKAYESLTRYGNPSLFDQVMAGYREGVSHPGEGVARQSALLTLLDQPEGHQGVQLEAESLERFTTWMDTYAQRAGSFSPEQELELERLRQKWADLLVERGSVQSASVETR